MPCVRTLAVVPHVVHCRVVRSGATVQGVIIVHAGNRIDGPCRSTVRFPSSEIERVAIRVREFFALVQPRVVVSAPASGADLIVLAEALRADIDVTVVLPIAREAFVEVSVADGPSAVVWSARFDSVLAAATQRPDSEVITLDFDPDSKWWFPANDRLLEIAESARRSPVWDVAGGAEPVAALVVRPLPTTDPPSVTDDLAAKAAAAGMVVFTLDPRPLAVTALSMT